MADVVAIGSQVNWKSMSLLEERERERWSLSLIIYFNLVLNISIVSIWSLTFQSRVNLVYVIIYWMKINDMSNSHNKILVYCHIDKN